jgi:hypothetical protein
MTSNAQATDEGEIAQPTPRGRQDGAQTQR